MDIADGRRRTAGHGHPIGSPFELMGSFELKIGIPLFTPCHGICYPDVDNRPCSI